MGDALEAPTARGAVGSSAWLGALAQHRRAASPWGATQSPGSCSCFLSWQCLLSWHALCLGGALCLGDSPCLGGSRVPLAPNAGGEPPPPPTDTRTGKSDHWAK